MKNNPFSMTESWRLRLSPEAEATALKSLRDSAGPTAPYFILIVLSTLIAGFGLVANSTATVIGAMIVAPLMGPILGLALALVRNDGRLFRAALFAEASGVGLVVGTGILVAFMVGPSSIDFAASEIVGRTNPTLYDLMIGLAAGLAGAYCTANPRLSGSVAGVAIAVALVPPLTVTGLTTAGALAGAARWSAAFGSFMLFLANFLTIEIAAMLVFAWAGLGERVNFSLRGPMGRVLVVNALLLVLTTVFLGVQLSNLLENRRVRGQSLRVLQNELARVPGASISQLKVDRPKSKLRLEATITSRSPLTPELVAELESAAARSVGEPVQLVVRAVASTYVTSRGMLYEPPEAPPDPKQVMLARLEGALQRSIGNFPGAELDGFRVLESQPGAPVRVKLSLMSPYAFDPDLVGRLQHLVSTEFAESKVGLEVRTLLTSTASAEGYVQVAPPETRGEAELQRQERRRARQQRITSFMNGRVAVLDGFVWTQPLELEEHQTEEGRVIVRLRAFLQGPRELRFRQVAEWEHLLEDQLTSDEEPVDVVLTVNQGLGVSITYRGDDSERTMDKLKEALETKMEVMVRDKKGFQLAECFVSGEPGSIEVRALVYGTRPLDEKTVAAWQKRLSAAGNGEVDLTVESRVGSLVRSKRGRQQKLVVQRGRPGLN